ncbi:conjugal transfer protein MobB [Flavobacterium hibernum]|uniref:Relaxase n=1 Tax=Flavobacterium hibernum TaxID=37752 RepID=A0A0D0F104_9FLAO|nr:conjugal transfer protein MobB [Flavobacterium hibernum]KIO51617.1 relaxase [Flavobacterium hibernum]OXA85272.1 relaxase [Flavobacterium hibernum]STO11266.1 Relaxase/Mobilisation nuclease domain [Flavobacterium hibernum]
MIAKIGRGSSLYGALAYNYQKLEKESAQILFTQKIIQARDGNYSVEQLSRSFELHLLANRKTEKPVLHISLNPDPKDNVSDIDFVNMAQDYMKQMGYGNQPFVVFKHTDIDRTHIHIVSVCVDAEGRKISDKFEKRRSMAVCRMLEKLYSLISAVEKKQEVDNPTFNPVDYKAGDIKSQMASVLRYLPKYYQFQTFGAYNALLSLFKITAQEVKGEYNGIPKLGLVYFALNEKGEKASILFKASLFGKSAGFTQLQSHYERSRINLKDSPAKQSVKSRIESVMQSVSNESEFKKKLLEQGMNFVIRRNAEGRIYGVTFIDHKSRCVCNGSELGKNLSANSFNDWWNNSRKPENPAYKSCVSEKEAMMKTEIDQSPDFLRKENMPHAYEQNSFDVLGGLLPQAQAEDYEEQAFDNRMKRKVKRRRL